MLTHSQSPGLLTTCAATAILPSIRAAALRRQTVCACPGAISTAC
jgi:hypothetical protein